MAGVALGGGISLVTQRFSQRHADKVEGRRRAVARAEARRSERISLFDRFMTATQTAERVATDRHHGHLGGGEYYSRGTAAMDRVWVEQKILDVVAPPEVRRAVFEFALALDHVIWQGPGDVKVWKFLEKTRDEVLIAARKDFATLDTDPSGADAKAVE